MTDEYATELRADDVSVGDVGPELIIEDLEREDFVRYAGASGDFNPIHYDVPYAREAGNPDIIAQGMLTAGFAAHMVADWFGLSNVERFGVRFQSPVFPGDTVEVTGEVTNVSRMDDGVCVDASLRIDRQSRETVLTGSVTADLRD